MSRAEDEETLASLAPAPPPEAPQAPAGEKSTRGRRAATAANEEDEATLASLAAPVRREGKRPRYDRVRQVLHECILGYQEHEEDPQQSGSVAFRHSTEIDTMVRENKQDPPPVAKSQRGLFVWVAKTEPVDGKEMFTMDPEQMKQVVNYVRKDQNVCDVCGQAATEELFEFRCYKRKMLGEVFLPEERTLLPFISYIGKTCGSGLLGVRSDASKFRELVFRFVQGLDGAAPEALQAFWQSANPTVRGMLLNELGIMAGIEAGDRRATLQEELRRLEAKAESGPLHRVAEDPFRALGRALCPALSARDLAAATVLAALERGEELDEGSYMAEVQRCLGERKPLPPPPAPWPASDVAETLQSLVQAWPMNIKLHSLLHGTQEFTSEATAAAERQPQREEVTVPARGKVKSKKGATASAPAAEAEQGPVSPPCLGLAYASGCQALYGPQTQRLEASQLTRLKDSGAELLQRARATFGVGASGEGSSGTGSGKGPTSREDLAIVVPDGKVEAALVQHALQGITWPQCSSRANVRPAGQATIDAFMLGLIKPYFQGLMCSRRTRMLPNLTKLCARMAADVEGIAFTSIQLNKDYNARLHVDKNNHGPSWIIGLGDYEGGELWVLDEEQGNHELEIDEHMHGFRHLFGRRCKGKLIDIKNKWCKFNGNLPHKAMSFRGTRISIVYFTRKGWLEMEPSTMRQLKEMGFPIPEEGWQPSWALDVSHCQSGQDSTLVQQPRFAQGIGAPAGGKGEDSEDEVDETEEMHFEGSQERRQLGWAARVLETLGGQWDEARPHLGLVSFRAGLGPGSALALQELFPLDHSRVLCVAEDKEAPEGRTAAGRIRVARLGVKAECGFSSLEDFVNGKGFCEVRHEGGTRMPDREGEQIFVGSLLATPISANQFAQRGGDDRWSRHLRAVRGHLATRQPPVVLLDIEDWGEVHARHQQRVLEIALDDPELGLRGVPGYSAEPLELRLQDCGLPLAGSRAFILALRSDCGGKEELQAAVALARVLLSRMPRCSAPDLMLEEGDTALAETKKEWTRSGTPGPPVGRQRSYTEYLRQECGHEFVDANWFPVEEKPRLALNVAYEDARKAGLDTKSLIMDLSQAPKQKPWRDDGLLPCCRGSRVYGPHYSFLRHRPLTGREELLCRALPVDRLQLKGFSDADLRRMAPAVTPPPAAGAALSALLAVADLKLPQGRQLKLPQATLQELIANAPPPPPGSLAAEALASAASGTSGQAQAPSEGDQLSSRAVAYLNLISGFGGEKADQEALSADDRKTAAALEKAAKAAVDAAGPDELALPADAAAENPFAAAMAGKPDEARDWNKRRTKLTNWDLQHPAITADMALRWVLEASEHDLHREAGHIIRAGCDYVLKVFAVNGPDVAKRARLEEARKNSDLALASQLLGSLLPNLRELGFEESATSVESAVHEAVFLKKMTDKDPSVLVTGGSGREWATQYVKTVVQELQGFKGRRAWLCHMAEALHKGWDSKDFQAANGFEALVEFIDDFQTLMTGGWSKAWLVLKVLAEKSPATVRGMHRRLHAATNILAALGQADRESSLRREVEQAMVKIASDSLGGDSLKRADEILNDFRRVREPVGARFEATKKLVSCVQRFQVAAAAGNSDDEPSTKWKRFLAELEGAAEGRDKALIPLQNSPHIWGDLKTAEDGLLEETSLKVRRLEQSALHREDQEKAERHEAEAKAKRQQQEERREGLNHLLQDALTRLRRSVDSFGYGSSGRRPALSDGLRDGSFKILKDLAEGLVAARSNFETEGGEPGPEVAEVLQYARELGRDWCQRPARLALTRRRLRDLGLGCCQRILEAGQLLGRLHELQASANAEMLLEGLGLPPGMQQQLLQKARGGDFDEERLRPIVPRGFRVEIYQPSGLEVLVDDFQNRQYEWPEPPDLLQKDKLRPIPALPNSCRTRMHGYFRTQKEAPYICREGERDGRLRCMLCRGCPDAEKEHFQAGDHPTRLCFWTALVKALDGVREDVKREASTLGSPLPPGTLVALWREELLQSLEQVRAAPDVLGIFWQWVVMELWPGDAPRPELDGAGAELALVAKALDVIMERAVMPEPNFLKVPPQPGKDFVCYPAPGVSASLSDETPQEQVETWGPKELLGEGIEVRASGLWCGFCEEEIGEGQLVKHIHPYYTTGKRHRKCMQICREALEQLQKDGWTLDAEGVSLSNRTYSCIHCKKQGEPWYQVWEHVTTVRHRNACQALPTPPPSKVAAEQAAWSTALDSQLEDHLSALTGRITKAAAARPVPSSAPTGTPKESRGPEDLEEPRPSSAKRRAVSVSTPTTSAAAVKATPPKEDPPDTTSAPASPAAEGPPQLPVPGKDFPWLKPGDDGLEERDGRLFCIYCNNNEVRNRESHLSRKDHENRAAYFFEALGQLRREGWCLAREGITLVNMDYKCKFCETQGYWWDLFKDPRHWQTKRHVGYRRRTLGDLPDNVPETNPQRQAWDALFSELEANGLKGGQTPQRSPEDQESVEQDEKRARKASPAAAAQKASPPAALSSTAPATRQADELPAHDDPPPPAAKRPRTTVTEESKDIDPKQSHSPKKEPSPPPASAGGGKAAGKGGAPVKPRAPKSAEGYNDPPDSSSSAAAQKRAESVWCPALPHPALAWGYFRKPHLWVWCTACKAWVAVVEFNYNTQVGKTDDGECPHYDSAASKKFNAAMQEVLRGKW